MNFAGNGTGKGFEEARGRLSVNLVVQLHIGELRCPVDGDTQIELAFFGLDLGDVNLEITDRIGLEFLLGRLVDFGLGQPTDAMALKATVQG